MMHLALCFLPLYLLQLCNIAPNPHHTVSSDGLPATLGLFDSFGSAVPKQNIFRPWGHNPPASWSASASIEVKHPVIRYAPELDPVLHGVSFSTKGHEKIKTCAQITIIPQDAVLFFGTIRSNIDPFKGHTNEAVWESLDRAHLSKASDRLKKTQVGTAKPNSTGSSSSATINNSGENHISAITSLNQQVSDGGNNFSQGQRQLLCLARALLKNSNLIIMDEATASVDFDTDTKIQTTIREEFTNSTLLCIAHRLRTVIDYDHILELDQGCVAEYDTPYNLVVKGKGVGIFKSMCEKSGEMEELVKVATESHLNKEQEEEQGMIVDSHVTIY